MLAAVLDHGVMRLLDRPRPVPGPDEALIKVRLAGICNTDLELAKGYMHFSGIPGHEFVGRVVEAPGDPGLIGARVTADINIGCGTCPTCRKSGPRHCPNRRTLGIAGQDGAFAEYVALPLANLHVLPDGISDEEAVFVEPLAAALEPGQQLHLTADQSVLVLGDGKLGILCACGLRYLVPGLVLAGRHSRKLALAAAQGVTTRLVGDPTTLVREYGRFDVVVEATGRPEGLGCALDLVRPEGVVVMKTTTFAPTALDMAKVVVDEISLVGSRCGNFELAGAYLRDRLVNVLPLIEAIRPFQEWVEAMEAAARPGTMKVLLSLPRS
jgi:threonine dehydrogenase-like Zn-dependent dehydrogenase